MTDLPPLASLSPRLVASKSALPGIMELGKPFRANSFFI
jgi:hypothetical protein